MTTWDQLEHGLAATLSGLTERTKLVVSDVTRPTVYVHFQQASSELQIITDVAGGAGTDGNTSSHPSVELQLQGLGLDALVASQPDRGWGLSVPWPLRWAQYLWLASTGLAVLRNVHRIAEPAQLEYRAWREAQPPPRGVTYYREDLQPAAPQMQFDELGIADASGDGSGR